MPLKSGMRMIGLRSYVNVNAPIRSRKTILAPLAQCATRQENRLDA